jgi:hypothetical protein
LLLLLLLLSSSWDSDMSESRNGITALQTEKKKEKKKKVRRVREIDASLTHNVIAAWNSDDAGHFPWTGPTTWNLESAVLVTQDNASLEEHGAPHSQALQTAAHGLTCSAEGRPLELLATSVPRRALSISYSSCHHGTLLVGNIEACGPDCNSSFGEHKAPR